MCAAPGAKTLQLASLGADVTAVDISASRLELLRENLERCGLRANIIESDAFNIVDKFDIVLLDAPCSATGDRENNEQEVFNQTLAICTDLIGMLRHSSRQSLNGVNGINEPIYFTQDKFTIAPFEERFDNLCCGYVFNIGVLVQNDFQTCDIPVATRGAGY